MSWGQWHLPTGAARRPQQRLDGDGRLAGQPFRQLAGGGGALGGGDVGWRRVLPRQGACGRGGGRRAVRVVRGRALSSAWWIGTSREEGEDVGERLEVVCRAAQPPAVRRGTRKERRPAAAAAIGVAALAIAAGRSGGGGGERRGGPKVDEVYLVLRRAAARTGAEV